jgi:HSP20 family protein
MAEWARKLVESFEAAASRPPREATWAPAADVCQGRHEWLVKFELAGVRVEDMRLHVEGRCVEVQGVRRDRPIVDGQRVYSLEIAYHRFQRRVELPFDLRTADVRSEYRDGMLLVRIVPRRTRHE